VEASEVAISDESDGESKATEAQRGPARAPASKPAPSKKERADDSRASGAAAPAGPPPSPAAAPEPESFSACDLACRAFSSMRRSAERICEIAGAADARCTRARSRVEEASERIERARCACRDD
jgi:hypothetical protein